MDLGPVAMTARLAGPMELETPRLRLRQWCDSDRAAFAAMNADPQVMEYFPSLQTRTGSDASIDAWQAQFASQGWSNWAAELLETCQFIGFVGLSVPRRAFAFSPCVEIGWRLARPFWGRGLATEAAREALRFGFERLELREIVSFTALGNRRSRAVMERIGLRDANQDFEHPGVPEGSPLRAHCLYRIRRGEYRFQQRVAMPDAGMVALMAGELVLEPLVVEHAHAMFEVLREPALYRYLDAPAPPSVDHLRSVYARQQGRRSADGTQIWLNWVVRPAGGDPIGFVQATITAAQTAWVGFVFASAQWGRGHAFAAMQAMLAHLGSVYGVESWLATVEAQNLRSIRLLERLGFRTGAGADAQGQPLAPNELLFSKSCEARAR